MKKRNYIWKDIKDIFENHNNIAVVSDGIYYTSTGMGVEGLHHNDDEIVTIYSF